MGCGAGMGGAHSFYTKNFTMKSKMMKIEKNIVMEVLHFFGGLSMDIKSIDDSIVFGDKTLTKRIVYSDKQVLSFILNIKPGQTLPVHKHENSTLVAIVLSGKGELKINQETENIEKGTIITAKGDDDFSIPRVDENLSLFVSISPNPSNTLYSKEFG